MRWFHWSQNQNIFGVLLHWKTILKGVISVKQPTLEVMQKVTPTLLILLIQKTQAYVPNCQLLRTSVSYHPHLLQPSCASTQLPLRPLWQAELPLASSEPLLGLLLVSKTNKATKPNEAMQYVRYNARLFQQEIVPKRTQCTANVETVHATVSTSHSQNHKTRLRFQEFLKSESSPS